jgi:hypothetical protein
VADNDLTPREAQVKMDISSAEILRLIGSIQPRQGIDGLSLSHSFTASPAPQWSSRSPRSAPSEDLYISSNTQHVPSTVVSSSRYTCNSATTASTTSTSLTTVPDDDGSDFDDIESDDAESANDDVEDFSVSERSEDAEAGERDGDAVYPCEFFGFSDCQEKFKATEFDGWFDHIAGDHLQYDLPQESVCWYCDDEIYRAPSRSHEDLMAFFRKRLLHIARHLRGELGPGQIRPDFWFVQHIRKLELIDDETVNLARSWHELPMPTWLNTTPIRPLVSATQIIVERPGRRAAGKNQTYWS